ncbi:MAG: cytochrome c [Aquabacterium sp.]
MTSRLMTIWRRALASLLVLGMATSALVAWLNVRGEAPMHIGRAPTGAAQAGDAAQIARGAYLAKAGNCSACHTARGGAEMAGGLPMATPFGTLYTSNLTPDRTTGLGDWSADEFWRALHHGRSKSGRLLYPAFPYPNYTHVTREDSDALYAYLQSLPPIERANTPHALRFPYKLQAALAVWRALYFRPVDVAAAPIGERTASTSPAWQRGRYLVQGLGHCSACHAQRNALGAISDDVELGGGLIPMQDWYAPSLAARNEASVADWPTAEVVALLRTGVAPKGSVLGPMAEVVYRGTQYLRQDDLEAIALYLKSLPQVSPRPRTEVVGASAETLQLGKDVYARQCADCHGAQGQGVPHMYPPLAGNRAVTLAGAHNVLKVILHGGFAPATAGNPRPFGMPPFGPSLQDEEIAAVATFIRQSWGHQASAVSTVDVNRARSY